MVGMIKTAGTITVLLAVVCSIANADTVELLYGSRVVQETDSGSESIDILSLPTQTASLVNGASGYGAGTYDLLTAFFDFGLEHAGLDERFYGRSTGEMYFYVSEDLAYRLASTFTSEGSSAWTTFMDLTDLITGETLFADVQFSGSEPLSGVVPDDASGQNEGNPQGVLAGDHKFRLRYVLYSMLTGGQAESPPEPGMFTANINSLFGTESVIVPLPAAAWMGISLFGSMVGFRVYRHCRRRFVKFI